MARSFREHQLIKIAQYIRSYYSGSFYIEQSGPFRLMRAKPATTTSIMSDGSNSYRR